MGDVHRLHSRKPAPGPARPRVWLAVLCLALMSAVARPSAVIAAEPATDQASGARLSSLAKRITIEEITKMLKGAKGIGIWTKLILERRVNVFTEDFYWFHRRGGESLSEMRARFYALHKRIAGALKPRNPKLWRRFMSARDALWHSYKHPNVFSQSVGKNVVRRIEGGKANASDER